MKYLIIWQHFFRINNPPAFILLLLVLQSPALLLRIRHSAYLQSFFYRLLIIAFAATSSSVLQYTGMYVVQDFEIWLPLRHKFCCLPEVFHFTQTSMKESGLKKRNILLKRLSAPWNYAWPINNPVNYILAGKKEVFLLGFCKIRLKITSSLRMELHIRIFDSYAHA